MDSDLGVALEGVKWGEKQRLQRRSVSSISRLAFVPLPSEGKRRINQQWVPGFRAGHFVQLFFFPRGQQEVEFTRAREAMSLSKVRKLGSCEPQGSWEASPKYQLIARTLPGRKGDSGRNQRQYGQGQGAQSGVRTETLLPEHLSGRRTPDLDVVTGPDTLNLHVFQRKETV